jgi:hypothetical protein
MARTQAVMIRQKTRRMSWRRRRMRRIMRRMRRIKVKGNSSILHQNKGVSYPDNVGLRGLNLIDLQF